MAMGSVPYSFTAGSTIVSAQVNSNFSTLYTKALDKTGDTMTGTLTARSIITSTDNTYDLGASGATRFRDFYLARNAVIGGTLDVTGATTVTGILVAKGNDFAVKQAGGSNVVTIASATGNTAIGGTLSVTGVTTLSAALTTNTGTLVVSAVDLAVKNGGGANVMTVAAASGDTAVGGNLAVTGATTLGTLAATTTTLSGNLLPSSNNTRDVGSSGTRWRDAYFAGSHYEQGRSYAMGVTQSVAYSSGNFTTTGTSTWTVQSGDQQQFTYRITGDTLTVNVSLVQTSFTQTAGDSVLKIAIPGGFTAQEYAAARMAYCLDNGVEKTGAQVYVSPSGTVINCATDASAGTAWANSTNNTYVQFQISFKVS